jgi:hypothetical protein
MLMFVKMWISKFFVLDVFLIIIRLPSCVLFQFLVIKLIKFL